MVYLATILDDDGVSPQIVEIAIVDHEGQFLLRQLVHPGRPPIDGDHGITERALAGKPMMKTLGAKLRAILSGKVVVSFDSKFDTMLFPKGVVACIDRYETYLDFHRTLLDKRGVSRAVRNLGTLEGVAGYLKYDWQGPGKNRAPARALRDCFIWHRLTEWGVGKRLQQKRAEADRTRVERQSAKQQKRATAQIVRAPAVPEAPPPAPRPATPARAISARDIERVFLDVETTGLDTEKDEIVQIAVIDETGAMLLNEHIMPKAPGRYPIVPSVSTASQEKNLRNKVKPIGKVIPKIIRAIKGKLVVTYKDFDRKMLPDECRQAAADFCDCFKCFSAINRTSRAGGQGRLRLPLPFTAVLRSVACITPGKIRTCAGLSARIYNRQDPVHAHSGSRFGCEKN